MIALPHQWERAIERILDTPKGVVFLLGGIDTGKTTFSQALAAAATEKGVKVGIIDADVGQSTFGPPATIGFVSIPKSPKFEKLEPSDLYFVGNNSPRGHLLQTVVGVKKMAERAFRTGCEMVIVDTSGLIAPPMGEALKFHKIDMLRPRHIVAFQRAKELKSILEFLEGYRYFRLHRLAVPSTVPTISTEKRIEIRRKAYSRYFKDAQLVGLDLGNISIFPPDADVGRRLDLMHLLVGLKDDRGQTLGIGILTHFYPRRNSVEVLTPVGPSSRISGLVLGCIKLLPHGEEVERMPPWKVRKEVSTPEGSPTRGGKK